MFNKQISRKNTNSAKWEESVEATDSENTISLSVSDMDFKTSPEIISKMISAANHGVYGYTNISERYKKAVKHWMKSHFDWDISEEWIVFCPRIVQAVSLILQNNTEINDQVVIQSPFYSSLKNAIQLNDRVVETTSLVENNYCIYTIDFEDLEEKFSNGAVAFILCSPHNPVGRVWTFEELKKISDLCIKYNVLLISDESHADFAFEKKHIPAGKISELTDQVFICTSPSKTFNLPGLEVSNIIIPNNSLRQRFIKNLQQAGIHNPSYFAVPALEEAYLNSDEWLSMLKAYIKENYLFAKKYIEEYLPELRVVQSDGTYLMWVDCRKLTTNEEILKNWMFNKAKVVVSLGSSFGEKGVGFIRINLATPRDTLKEAFKRITQTKPSEEEKNEKK